MNNLELRNTPSLEASFTEAVPELRRTNSVIVGINGSGKTTLAKHIIVEAILHAQVVTVINASEVRRDSGYEPLVMALGDRGILVEPEASRNSTFSDKQLVVLNSLRNDEKAAEHLALDLSLAVVRSQLIVIEGLSSLVRMGGITPQLLQLYERSRTSTYSIVATDKGFVIPVEAMKSLKKCVDTRIVGKLTEMQVFDLKERYGDNVVFDYQRSVLEARST